jgi:hypothetical protein
VSRQRPATSWKRQLSVSASSSVKQKYDDVLFQGMSELVISVDLADRRLFPIHPASRHLGWPCICRYGPEAGSCGAAKKGVLPDHLVGTGSFGQPRLAKALNKQLRV